MQDKFNIDDQFRDMAWAEMAKTLDQEMPQKKKKRFAFYWLAAAGFAALLAAFLFLPANNVDIQSQKIESIQDKNENLVRKKDNTHRSTIASETANVETNQIAPTKIKEFKTITSNKNKKAQSNIVLKNETKLIQNIAFSNESVLNIPEGNTDKVEPSFNTIEPAAQKIESKQQSLNEVTNSLSIAAQKKNQNSSKIKVDKLPILTDYVNMQSTELDSPQFMFLSKISDVTIKSEIEKKWSFGFRANAFANNDFDKIQEFTLGTLISYHHSDKLDFYTGLGYTRRRIKSKNSSPAFDSSAIEMVETSFPDSTGSFDPNGSTIDPNASTANMSNEANGLTQFNEVNQYLDIPVGLRYKLNKKLIANLGIGSFILLNNSISELNRRIVPYANTGIGYAFNKHIELGLNYRISASVFKSLINDGRFASVPIAADLAPINSIPKEISNHHTLGISIKYHL